MNLPTDHWTRKALARLSLLVAMMILAPVTLHGIGQGTVRLQSLCATAQSTSAGTSGATLPDPNESPLLRLHPFLSTAQQLGGGEVMFNFRGRLYDSPSSIVRSGIAFFYDAGFSWGIIDDLELTLQFQHVDSGFPGQQGPLNAVLTADNEGTMALRYTIWHNADRSLQLGSSVALSLGDRGVRFSGQGRAVTEDNQDIIPSFQLPFTAVFDGYWNVTVAPAVAIFPDDHALYLARPPLPDADSFGPLFGFSAAVVYPLLQRVVLWGDIFVPVMGNNSINRSSGQPDTAIAFNAGMRYLINPRLAWDLYATNTLGSVGSLAFLADRDNVGFGTSVAFLPDVFTANRHYADSFAAKAAFDDAAPTVDGLAFFDGGTIPSGAFMINMQGGSQGILGALHFSPVRALELAVYMDYIGGSIDESEQGVGIKLRLLNQAADDVLTASVAFTVGLTNRVFVNFFNNDRQAFADSGLEKNVPFLFNGDNGTTGELFIATLSLPLHYRFTGGAALWLTPTLGVVQRRGIEIAGANVGGSLPVIGDFLSVMAEVGGNIAGEGNVMRARRLGDAAVWAAAVRLHLDRLLPRASRSQLFAPRLEVFVTNRVGSSPFHSLRVQADNDLAFGAGLSVPWQF